ncbi:hypothetical protein C7534_103136 [Pseudomonas sp. OV226]|nr:hypothetical protein C7534_103136 [Pseudomonas sp. OV226]
MRKKSQTSPCFLQPSWLGQKNGGFGCFWCALMKIRQVFFQFPGHSFYATKSANVAPECTRDKRWKVSTYTGGGICSPLLACYYFSGGRVIFEWLAAGGGAPHFG